MGTFDETDLQKAYARAQGKDYETVIIVNISCHIERKLQALTKTEPFPGLDIEPAYNPSINSGLTLGAATDGDASLLVGASLALDPARDDVYILGDDVSLFGIDFSILVGESLKASTVRGHIRASKIKQDTLFLTQEFNVTLKKEREANTAALEEAVVLKVRISRNVE